MTPGYRELNAQLRSGDLVAARPHFPYSKLLQTALEKMPAFPGGIWRAIDVDFAALRDTHQKGSRVAWLQFNSCTTDGETLLHFAGGGSRTLFMVDAGHSGVDVREYSDLPESEVLLAAGTELEVTTIIPASADLTIVHLKQVEPAAPAPAPAVESEGLLIESTCDTCGAAVRLPLLLDSGQRH